MLRERAVGHPEAVEERFLELEAGERGEGTAAREVGAEGGDGGFAGWTIWGVGVSRVVVWGGGVGMQWDVRGRYHLRRVA